MPTDLDLRSRTEADRRKRIFATLDDVDVGESAVIGTDDDLDVLLHRYQIKRESRLEWEYSGEAGGESTEDRAVEVTKTARRDAGALTEFDVREMPPQRRHEVLTETFDDLDPGEGFVLVNDHDPKPLYHELQSTRGDTFEWEYTNRDPSEWKVEIVKTAQSAATADDVVATFDVREIPKPERHPTIHHRYGNVPEGGAMEIVAPHEPRPLHREFQQRYGDAFTWDVVATEPGRCRVRITKDGGNDGGSDEGMADESDGASVPSSESATESLEVTRELDVRDLPPTQRHEQIYDAYGALGLGEAFVLVNDHDPKPLYHQFDAEAGDEFRWEYQQQEPGEFRVLIGKDETASSDSEPDGTPDAPF